MSTRTVLLAGVAAAGVVSGLLLATPQLTTSAGRRATAVLGAAERSSPMLSNDEVVLATLGPSGLPDEVVLVSRVSSVDQPEQVIRDPASVTNVKYLDRLGRPQTVGSDVLLPVGGPGLHTVLTEARFDEPLPVAVHAQYEIGGQVVAPEAVPGSDQEVRITYTLTNTTATTQTLTYTDAAGSQHDKEVPVFAPFAGSAVVTLPADTEVISAKHAIRYSDRTGNTVLAWNVSLYPPLTTYTQELTLTTRAPRAGIPALSVRLVPVRDSQDPALAFGADLLDGAVTGNEKLYSGLRELDDQASTLADGAGSLASGLAQLASGAGAATGATSQLAGGLDALSSGAGQLASGNQQLADALTGAAAGARQLASATTALAAADTAAAATAMTQLIGAADGLAQGVAVLADRFGSAADPPLPAPLPAPDGDNTCTARPTPTASATMPAAATASATAAAGAGSTGAGPTPSAQVSGLPGGAGGSDGTAGTATPAPTGTPSPAATFDDDCVTLYQGVRALVAGLGALGQLAGLITTEAASATASAQALVPALTGIGTDAGTAAAGAAALAAQACAVPPALSPAQCAALAGVAQSAGRAAQATSALTPTMTALLTSLGTLSAYGSALSQAITAAGTAGTQVLAGMDALAVALRSQSPTAPGLAEGLAGLHDGLVRFAAALDSSSAQLATALDKVASGTDQLASGVAQAASGADKLASGAHQVASGVGKAASGADQLASGIGALASGADAAAAGGSQLATGAAAFQEQGTATVATSVLDASTQPALAQAWLSAASDRAADAMPYGPPEGATGHVAYLMDIPAVAPPRPGLWDRVRDWLTG